MMLHVLPKWKEIYFGAGTCFACHGENGLGLVGPNIIDDQWIYGSNMMDIFNTILKGRRGPNGEEMPMHRGRFTTDEIISVAAFVADWSRREDGNEYCYRMISSVVKHYISHHWGCAL